MEENEPVYIEFADALEFYAAIINGTVGQAANQLRDQAGLQSALVFRVTSGATAGRPWSAAAART